jgi:hypothetical protein
MTMAEASRGRVQFRRAGARDAGQVDGRAGDEAAAAGLRDQRAAVDDRSPRESTVTGQPVTAMPSKGE